MSILLNVSPKQPQPEQNLQFLGFPHGLNTYYPEHRLTATEASTLVNWNILPNGTLASRPGITQYTNSATDSNATVKHIKEVNIGGTLYTLLVDSNYKLYYLDTSY